MAMPITMLNYKIRKMIKNWPLYSMNLQCNAEDKLAVNSSKGVCNKVWWNPKNLNSQILDNSLFKSLMWFHYLKYHNC
jgi:hypothetical protein